MAIGYTGDGKQLTVEPFGRTACASCFRVIIAAFNCTQVGQQHAETDFSCRPVLLYNRQTSCCDHVSFGNSYLIDALTTPWEEGGQKLKCIWCEVLISSFFQRVSPAWNEDGALFSFRRDNHTIRY
jgi:hypothetical protein